MDFFSYKRMIIRIDKIPLYSALFPKGKGFFAKN
jgi:hypothetical protein